MKIRVMIKLKYTIYTVIILINLYGVAKAQSPEIKDTAKTEIPNKIVENYILNHNLWLNTENAGGLSSKIIPGYGNVTFIGSHENGGFKSCVEPTSIYKYGMDAYGFKSLKHVHLSGTYSYRKNIEKELEWTSMMDPIRENPYIIADSVGGDWKKDYNSLSMRMATNPIWELLRFGVAINYDVSQGGRDNDPRPKSTIKDIGIKPSLLFDINNRNKFGLSFLYSDYRQDISIMNKYGVGGSAMYKIMGLALKEKPITKSSISYRIDNWKRGAALQYAHDFNRLNLLAELKYNLLTEKAVQSPYKSMEDPETGEIYSIAENDVKYSEETYNFCLGMNYSANNSYHVFNFNALYGEGSIYNLTTEQVELNNNRLHIKSEYNIYTGFTDQDKISNYGLKISYYNTETENLFYATQTINKMDFELNYQKAFILFKNKFSFIIDVQYSYDLDSDLNIDTQSPFIEASTAITEPFVINNFNYAISDYVRGNIELVYYKPIRNLTNSYVGISAGKIYVTNSQTFFDKTREYIAIKLGLTF